MLKLETVADLQRLISEEIKESLTLDYKASPALGKADKQRDELCKDVTAFANSAGGQIVYGMVEDKHVPTKVDEGADPSITKEWLEQVIDSRVQPRIEGLIITPIQLGKRLGFVLTIPQATSRAPHQSPDKRYYKRQNFQSVAMEDYEVRDALRRATTPDLDVELSFAMGPSAPIVFSYQREVSNPIVMVVTVTNRSSQPAFHALIKVGIDTELSLSVAADFHALGRTGDEQQQYWLGKQISSPPGLPIFKEVDPSAGFRFPINLTVHSSALGGEKLFHLTTVAQAPGFSATEKWVVHQRGSLLRMCPPGHPLNR
jgi:Schlafen, AlbA_2